MLHMINEVAKIEFDFLINGLKVDLIELDPEEVILLIDRKTKQLKLKMFNTDKKKQITAEQKKVASVSAHNEENATPVFKETNHKLILDEEF